MMAHQLGHYNKNFGNGEEIGLAVSESIKSGVLICIKVVKYHHQRNASEPTGRWNTCTKRTICS